MSMNPALALANRTLERERWAREKLAAHAGKTLRIRAGPASTLVAIGHDGQLSKGTGAPDLTLAIPVLRIPALLAEPQRFAEMVDADGDVALAETIAELAITLPWFIEEALSAALGPIAGTRISEAGQRLLLLPGHAAESFAASLGGYLRDEARTVLRKADSAAFAAQLANLAQRVDALVPRVDAIAAAGGDAKGAPDA